MARSGQQAARRRAALGIITNRPDIWRSAADWKTASNAWPTCSNSTSVPASSAVSCGRAFTVSSDFSKASRRKTALAAPRPSGQTNKAVRIMSIHRSKGLEFPVVFLPDLGKEINLSDAHGAILVDRQMGLGMDVVEPDRLIRYPSLASVLVSQNLHRQTIAEELRLLYVAMTRAKEHVILVATCAESDRDKWKTQWENRAGPLSGRCDPVSPASDRLARSRRRYDRRRGLAHFSNPRPQRPGGAHVEKSAPSSAGIHRSPKTPKPHRASARGPADDRCRPTIDQEIPDRLSLRSVHARPLHGFRHRPGQKCEPNLPIRVLRFSANWISPGFFSATPFPKPPTSVMPRMPCFNISISRPTPVYPKSNGKLPIW